MNCLVCHAPPPGPADGLPLSPEQAADALGWRRYVDAWACRACHEAPRLTEIAAVGPLVRAMKRREES